MSFLDELLGHDPAELTVAQVSLRAVIVFVATLVYLRLADRRVLGRYAAFDAVLAIIFGAVVSRGINGTAPFVPTLAAGAVLIFLHWLVGALAYRSSRFRVLVEGVPYVLVRDGQPEREALARMHISDDELSEAMRYEGGVESLSEVQRATMECNGKISIIKRRKDGE